VERKAELEAPRSKGLQRSVPPSDRGASSSAKKSDPLLWPPVPIGPLRSNRLVRGCGLFPEFSEPLSIRSTKNTHTPHAEACKHVLHGLFVQGIIKGGATVLLVGTTGGSLGEL